MNATNKKAPGARGIPQPFNQQAGHAPQRKPVVAQLKTGVSAQSVKSPVAPPVYHPQQVPKVLQTKSATTGQQPQAGQAPRQPVAPPVYRPDTKKIVQPKTAATAQAPKHPKAPPAYRPQPVNKTRQGKTNAPPLPTGKSPAIVQGKIAGSGAKSSATQTPAISKPGVPHHQRPAAGVVQPLIVTIGAYPRKQEDTPQRAEQYILINSIPVMKYEYGEQKDVNLEAGVRPLEVKGYFEDLIVNAHGNTYSVGGLSAEYLAAELVRKGYEGGGKIILSTCKSAAYAKALSDALRKNHSINVEVIGALARVASNTETVIGFGEKGWSSSTTHGTEGQSLLGTTKPESNSCFLTTACVQAMSLPDDCAELETLRRFRDEHLLNWPGGDIVVEQYYAIAPCIVSAIDEDPERDLIYTALYGDLIAPCVSDIQSGRFESAYIRYHEAVFHLQSRFIPNQVLELRD